MIAFIFTIVLVVSITSGFSFELAPENQDLVNNVPAESGVSAHNLTATDMKLISAADFSWIRVNVWDNPGGVTTMAAAYHVNVLSIVENYNRLADGNLNYDAWNSTVRSSVSTYLGQVQAWEILNEPLLHLPQGYYVYFPAVDYFNMQKYAYEIIKSSDPGVKVIGFGGIRVIDGQIQNVTWVQDLVNMGALNYCDAVSVHFYSSSTNAMATQMNFKNALENLKSILENKEIWITETGQPSDMNQVAYINAVYPMFATNGINYIFWYEWRDWVPDHGKHFGLLHSDFSERPSYEALKEINMDT